jgi:hypothetical protein
MKNAILKITVTLLLLLPVNLAFPHCDTMDGPVVADARKAIEQNNVNFILKWVPSKDENEIKQVFDLIMKVRVLSPEAGKLADSYLFETLVRIHRSGEGVPYTGVMPSGTPIDENILAADKSIALGNLSPLKNLVPKGKLPELQERFDRVMSLKDFDVNDVEAGRKYIEAYVQFFHYAEGEAEEHAHGQTGAGEEVQVHGNHFEGEETHAREKVEEGGPPGYLPWILSGIFFITSILFGTFYFQRKGK